MWYRFHVHSWYNSSFSKNTIYHHILFSNFNIIILLYFGRTDQEENICLRGVIRYAYSLWLKFRNIGKYFEYIVTSNLPFWKWVQLVKLCRKIFVCIITNKWVLLSLFAAAPPNVTPISSPIFANLGPPYNTDPNRHLSRPGQKGVVNNLFSYGGYQKLLNALEEGWKILVAGSNACL